MSGWKQGSEVAYRAMTHEQFVQMFPTDDACLEYLKERFCPDGGPCPHCRRASKFHRISARAAYSCQFCGGHVYPAAGTIFHRSRTSLQLWFWTVFLMSSTRCRISARELEREIGVTFKTAQRMVDQVRPLLAGEDLHEPADELPPPRPQLDPAARSIWNARRRRG